MSKIKLYKKYLKLFFKKKYVTPNDIGVSYTKVSENYEDVFLSAMHIYNDGVLEKLIELLRGKDQLKILDLACGTGYNTRFLKDKLSNAAFILCDLSEGMLNEARKIKHENISIHQGDMLEFLKNYDSNSIDAIVCSWAIKYSSPNDVVKESFRVLKPGGYMGCIVNKKSTLPEGKKIIKKLFENNVKEINNVMLSLPNPLSRFSFNRWFLKNNFKQVLCSEGEHIFKFNSSLELTEFFVSTGALAGYDVMLDLHNKKVKSEIKSIVEKKKINKITHKFVLGVYRKEEEHE